MRAWLLVVLAFLVLEVSAQTDSTATDSTRVLDELVVKAYRSDRPLIDVPVTVNVIDTKDMIRFGPMSLVTTVNTIPGVRMEERSPGSYRFSIRGSLLRSPFGIRNVKFYYRGLPFTDAGGNTYLQSIDMASLGNMEVIKGPGASLYGAGTGGVVLMDAPIATNPSTSRIQYVGGSYGLSRLMLSHLWKFKRSSFDMGLSWQKSDGYREQTAMNRANIRLNYDQFIKQRGKLMITFLGGGLGYQTPGGLNTAQFTDNPRQARPASPVAPGAVEQKASIGNASYYWGASYQQDWNEHWSTTTGAYTMITSFKNPAILNYEMRNENNSGGRTETQYTFGEERQKGKITFGAEFQSFYQHVRVYDNNQGEPGNERTLDKLRSNSFFGFAQAEFDLPYQFLFTAGGSANFLKYKFDRYSTDPSVKQNRKFDPGFFPRIALSKKFKEGITIYTSLSQGFSAPTLSEVRPSTGNFNNTLNPETGWSKEVGVRAEMFDKQLRLNVAYYDFRLKETIVVQSAQNGADYFINAGTTSQKGLESTLSFAPRIRNFDLFRIWLSYSYNNYHFLNYQFNGNDFSGNSLTGVPPTVIVTGIDMTLKSGWYLNVLLNHTERLPVNDANTEFASGYNLLTARFGKRQNIWKVKNVELFGGVDNILNEKYSLGNDLNAAGGRYYNAAPPRNFYLGITIPLAMQQPTKTPKTTN